MVLPNPLRLDLAPGSKPKEPINSTVMVLGLSFLFLPSLSPNLLISTVNVPGLEVNGVYERTLGSRVLWNSSQLNMSTPNAKGSKGDSRILKGLSMARSAGITSPDNETIINHKKKGDRVVREHEGKKKILFVRRFNSPISSRPSALRSTESKE